MQGMMMSNNKLVEVYPYGCHSSTAKNLFKLDMIEHSSGKVRWKDPLSKSCQYDRIDLDSRCSGCEHPKGKPVDWVPGT